MDLCDALRMVQEAGYEIFLNATNVSPIDPNDPCPNNTAIFSPNKKQSKSHWRPKHRGKLSSIHWPPCCACRWRPWRPA